MFQSLGSGSLGGNWLLSGGILFRALLTILLCLVFSGRSSCIAILSNFSKLTLLGLGAFLGGCLLSVARSCCGLFGGIFLSGTCRIVLSGISVLRNYFISLLLRRGRLLLGIFLIGFLGLGGCLSCCSNDLFLGLLSDGLLIGSWCILGSGGGSGGLGLLLLLGHFNF